MDSPHSYGTSRVYALLRIVVGFLFVFHGLQKLFGLFGGQLVPVMSVEWFAGLIELTGGPLVMFGLFTPAAAAICCTEMAAAYFIANQPRGGLPIQNQGEVPVLFCFAFLYITARGAGVWSVDAVRAARASIVGRCAPYSYTVMRIGFGFLLFCHGLQKVFGFFDGRIADLSSPRGVAGMIELVVGVMIVVGVYARPVAFLASGEMAVAYFLFQQPAGLWPIQNHGEPAVLYCFVFLYVAARGGGLLSVDHAVGVAEHRSTGRAPAASP